jgi:hypothetical protein
VVLELLLLVVVVPLVVVPVVLVLLLLLVLLVLLVLVLLLLLLLLLLVLVLLVVVPLVVVPVVLVVVVPLLVVPVVLLLVVLLLVVVPVVLLLVVPLLVPLVVLVLLVVVPLRGDIQAYIELRASSVGGGPVGCLWAACGPVGLVTGQQGGGCHYLAEPWRSARHSVFGAAGGSSRRARSACANRPRCSSRAQMAMCWRQRPSRSETGSVRPRGTRVPALPSRTPGRS